ncbi:MAG: hypothetical protein IH605_18210 [Burkholderiales bacterium]|nr:hypothetical protein [Burkholderiales bacterium]
MKHLVASSLVCLLGGPLIAGCASAGSPMPPTPAVLTESTEQCRAQLNEAARELRGRAVTLAEDAFMQNDAVVLTTVGQSASGRMLPPTAILRLQLTPQGCQLRLDGRDRTVALPHCSCRAVAGN